ncbi:hypothetical protein CBR_g88542 [Chara braunii]|uniref:Uncharacterized protein n=1 Tax=Chara braunii TaxID=69332 RepID=A0A388KBC4_CHABU|nr:hypothetical protein CBR_g88542 [Chara braunii]|eukprot:GBG67253.1 hypothetical protein CBR_g88542 [Chara braunii]
MLKSFEEEDSWGSKDIQRMMKLTLADTHSLVEEVRTIKEEPDQVEKHEELMGGMYLLVNTLLQGDFHRIGSLNLVENEDVAPESQDDKFEKGEIKEAFRAEEYDGIYLERGLLLSYEMRNRDASDRAQRIMPRYLVRDMTRDWESCRAHLREAFRRSELPQPRVERRQRSKRQRDPEPRETRPSRGGRKTLARREEELVPETEERGAYPECGLGSVEFHRFIEGGLGGSPQRAREEIPTSGEPLQELEAHMDVSQWWVPPTSEGRDEPAEEVPREEVQNPEQERRPSPERGHVVTEVIEAGEDTPPQTPTWD